jgi:ubiquitin carboxyl-terminal hydrolase 9/13
MIKGPVLELAQENAAAYGMQECTFTGLKDIFTALIESNSRTGVLSPQRFLEIFKRDNEMFRNSMHQDAHEFYGLVLNDIIANVEASGRKLLERQEKLSKDALAQSVENALGSTALVKNNGVSGTRSPGIGWVHDIFEGVLTSETRCLTCETASQRDETFLDLSIDLEEHSSVTSCLRKFSAEEMLCERNKFHCDHCGGLQEAEKRMKIKRLPKVLALHLKRFKYTEDYSRLQKLFHRVVYPYYLRMFNTTDDADDPDRIYELYAVVVHIGGNAYHGHYVSVIKTQDRGWLLFDDEMVEPVDKHFVRNFFGDKPGMACAYVLFYQETTFEKMREEQEAEGLEEVKLASQKADLALGNDLTRSNGVGTSPLSRLATQPISPVDDHDALAALNHAQTAPDTIPASPVATSKPQPVPAAEAMTHPLAAAPPPATAVTTKSDEAPSTAPKTKEEKEREKKELKAQEKARKLAEKEQAKMQAKQRVDRMARIREAQKNEQDALQRVLQESKQTAVDEDKKRKTDEPSTSNGSHGPSFLNRANRGSKTMTRKSFGFLGKGDKGDKAEKSEPDTDENGGSPSVPLASSPPPIKTVQSMPAVPPIPADKPDKPLKDRFHFGLGRKKSQKFLS